MSKYGACKVILLGGVGCTGKTTLAAQIMQRHAIPYFPLDYLMMGLVRGKKATSFMATDSADTIAAELWPIVKGMVMTSIENNHSMVFEGFQILPKEILSIDAAYTEHIVPLCLGLSNDYIDENFSGSIKDHRCKTELREFSDENVQQMKIENQKIKNDCARYGIPFFEATTSYSNMVDEALAYIERIISLGK